MSRGASTPGRVDMLSREGLTRKLIIFALPVLACGIIQQSFNAVDIAVVGKFVGEHALGAVGSNGPVIALMVNLFMGISLGSNVLIANFIGQRNRDGVRRAVSSSAALALTCGALMTIIGLTCASPILSMLNTPAEILDDATVYLRCVAIGFPGMMIFNFGAAILRSVGDTKRPFYCLVVGGLSNVLLDLLFVIVFEMGVEGVAIATSISNYITALCVVWILVREKSDIRINRDCVKFYQTELKKILRIGLPAGVQGMVFALSNVFIQSGINSFGTTTISGSAAALTMELYCYFIVVAFNQATLAFIGQNYGAGQAQMCRLIFRKCLMLSLVSCGVANCVIVTTGPTLLGIYTDSEAVIQQGMLRITTVLVYQFIACSYEIAGSAMRALGHSIVPMFITIFGTCLLRIVWCRLHLWHTFRELIAIYPVTWIITGTAMLVAYAIVSRRVLGPLEKNIT